jgi:hypothetical protein
LDPHLLLIPVIPEVPLDPHLLLIPVILVIPEVPSDLLSQEDQEDQYLLLILEDQEDQEGISSYFSLIDKLLFL